MPQQNKAPIIITDATILGDRLPRDNDSIAALQERIINSRQPFKLPNQSLLENTDMAVGGPLDPREFIRRLQKMEPRLIIETGGVINCVRVGIPTIDDDATSKTYGELIPTWLACGFPLDTALNEFSHTLQDRDGIPKREVRGWRTVLLRLILTGVVTYKQVKAEFGEPLGERGKLWREQMQSRSQA